MAQCPRCAVPVPPYTRCEGCGLVLGFDGITVLIEFEDSPNFERVRRIARRQSSCSEWIEENGRRLLRVTYSLDELHRFRLMAAAAAHLPRKHSFFNGLEIRWPAAGEENVLPQFPLPVPSAVFHNGRVASSSN
jgi:hypothetical protein